MSVRPRRRGPRPVVELAVRAEELGVDAIALADHVALGPDTSGSPFGAFPLPSDAHRRVAAAFTELALTI